MYRLLLAIALFALPAAAQAQLFLGKTAADWSGQLASADEKARRNAAFALGKLGRDGAPAVPALKKCLREDASPMVREAAAFALGDIAGQSLQVAGDADLIEALKEGLKHQHELVRRSSALALGQFGQDAAPAREALAAALKDNHPAVRQNAAWALGKLGKSAVADLRPAFSDTDRFVKRDAANALAVATGAEREDFDPATTRPFVGELCRMCEENDSEVRRAALRVLGRTVNDKDKAAADSIQKALRDKDQEVSLNAALALTNIDPKLALPGLPALRQALVRGDEDTRQRVALGIRKIGPDAREAVPDLMRALGEGTPKTRAFCAMALGGIGKDSAAAVPVLVKWITDDKEDLDLREQAGATLQEIGAVPAAIEAVPTLLKLLTDTTKAAKAREKVVWALRVHGRELLNINGIIPSFVQVVGEPKVPETKMLRYDCAYLLGILQGPKAPKDVFDTLLDYLKDPGVEVFFGVVIDTGTKTGEVQGPKAQARLRGIGDGRRMVLESLKRIGREKVAERSDIVEQLRVLSRDMDPEMDPQLREGCRKLLEEWKLLNK